MLVRPASKTPAQVLRYQTNQATPQPRSDQLATEEPLEIRLTNGQATQTLAVTMRTPGADFELAAGFLLAEGLISQAYEIERIGYCVDRELSEAQRYNAVTVTLRRPTLPDLRHLARHFMVTSACGVCGKTSIAALEHRHLLPLAAGPTVTAAQLTHLPRTIAKQQPLFQRTGGLHAAALFNTDGELLALREDVGRHNALDKLLGWALMNGHTPLPNHILLVSGRASYELVQKALVVGIPIFCAISAPSSLAVQLAQHFGMSLVGFLRETGFNLYTGANRIVTE